jgi:hypothetical protein
MLLKDATGVSLGKTFELTTRNRGSFEPALRRALIEFVKGDAPVTAGRFVFVRNAGEFSAAIHSADYTHVIYYGHALEGVNALLPTAGNRITVPQLAHAFEDTHVTHFDILGCQSGSIAADLLSALKTVKMGYLRVKRYDDIECDPRTLEVVKMTIEAQPVRHFGGAAP